MEMSYIWLLLAALIGLCVGWFIADFRRTSSKGNEKSVVWCGLDFIARTGFEFVSIPNAEFLSFQGSRIIDGFIAELEFKISDGETALFRAAVNTNRDISRKIHLPYSSTHHFSIDNVNITLYHNHAGPQLALWEKGKFRYSLFLPKPEPNLMNGLIQLFVRDASCRLSG